MPSVPLHESRATQCSSWGQRLATYASVSQSQICHSSDKTQEASSLAKAPESWMLTLTLFK